MIKEKTLLLTHWQTLDYIRISLFSDFTDIHSILSNSIWVFTDDISHTFLYTKKLISSLFHMFPLLLLLFCVLFTLSIVCFNLTAVSVAMTTTKCISSFTCPLTSPTDGAGRPPFVFWSHNVKGSLKSFLESAIISRR